jgi:hypothetical protein
MAFCFTTNEKFANIVYKWLFVTDVGGRFKKDPLWPI